ncbi:hypothetical protein K437DRAFT_295668 [Tilletiaria anomala UBC 951]|uniref:Oxo-4-hydroxy-4-carboxy-5-ureidoimidazoline decarboxylase domain-containing protein n=1 Tax=Tilletiaria anomala (strain ATCC 24038 / CBS 436.72 / UBC 951) TaxID=1037660 RepID=A0A066VRP4_TILAU|nr:uncharacterized protein K437DRAFT_295668 [Tilletiaria anomala UBC 951]KDN41255.1 hypothetical protein K437DRAFT_295668 [Tilletiaria anomala UBC 951]
MSELTTICFPTMSVPSTPWQAPQPSTIGKLSPAELEPVLKRLLECPSFLTPVLASQTAAAISELDEDSRPDTFEGLLDVARYCIDDDPGWDLEERRQLVGGHPPIGTKLTPGSLSEESRREQLKGGEADQETMDRLARLNALYNKRYPGLAFVTFVAGRPRAVVADELGKLLGPETVDAKVKAESFPDTLVFKKGSKEWLAEYERGYDALWQIAFDRAGKMAQGQPANTGAAAPTAGAGAVALAAAAPDPTAVATATGKNEKREEPFISLATFRMLALSSPVLESFFERDLSTSFQLSAPERSESGGAFAWHAAPLLPNSPRAIPGADGASLYSAAAGGGSGNVGSAMGGAISHASYSKDVTTGARGKVVGFLGGLLGEEGKAKMTQLADSVAQRLQTHTVTGPVPSFGRDRTLDGMVMDTAELRDAEERRRRQAADERKASFGARLAGVVRGTPASANASPPGADAAVPRLDDAPRGRKATRGKHEKTMLVVEDDALRSAAGKRASMRATDLAQLGPGAAVEALRLAATQERSHFVIDEVGDARGGGGGGGAGGGAGDADAEVEAEAEELGMDDAVAGAIAAAPDEAGRLEGKEAQLAKGEWPCAAVRG